MIFIFLLVQGTDCRWQTHANGTFPEHCCVLRKGGDPSRKGSLCFPRVRPTGPSHCSPVPQQPPPHTPFVFQPSPLADPPPVPRPGLASPRAGREGGRPHTGGSTAVPPPTPGNSPDQNPHGPAGETVRGRCRPICQGQDPLEFPQKAPPGKLSFGAAKPSQARHFDSQDGK